MNVTKTCPSHISPQNPQEKNTKIFFIKKSISCLV